MKKLKLNLQNIEGAELLTREQLKTVMGGVGGSGDDCDNYRHCKTNADCEAKKCGDTCSSNGSSNGNFCWYNPFG